MNRVANVPTQLAARGIRAEEVSRGREEGSMMTDDDDNGDDDEKDDAAWSWPAATESSTSRAGIRPNIADMLSLLAHAWRQYRTKRGCRQHDVTHLIQEI